MRMTLRRLEAGRRGFLEATLCRSPDLNDRLVPSALVLRRDVADAVVERARVDRIDDLVLGQAVLFRRGLVGQRGALPPPS